MKKVYIFVLFVINCSVFSYGQASIKDSCINASLITISYSYQIPGGDLSKRFYPNSTIGAGYLFKTKKNWFFGADGYFMFRDKVKETGILKNISTSDGNIIDGNGIYADVRLYERGYNLGLKTGKLIPFYGPNKNSGIMILCGTGFLQHKIRIENPDNSAPQIKDDYKKGYDKLSNGLMFDGDAIASASSGFPGSSPASRTRPSSMRLPSHHCIARASDSVVSRSSPSARPTSRSALRGR